MKSRPKKAKAPPPLARPAGRPFGPIDQSTPAGRFGARLRAAREKAGLTPAEAAGRAEVTPKRWTSWERGTRAPRLGYLLPIAAALGCDLVPLLGSE